MLRVLGLVALWVFCFVVADGSRKRKGVWRWTTGIFWSLFDPLPSQQQLSPWDLALVLPPAFCCRLKASSRFWLGRQARLCASPPSVPGRLLSRAHTANRLTDSSLTAPATQMQQELPL